MIPMTMVFRDPAWPDLAEEKIIHLGVAARREIAVRAGQYAPSPDKPHEALWAAQGPVPEPMLDTVREGGR
jgi:hypothetical protein